MHFLLALLPMESALSRATDPAFHAYSADDLAHVSLAEEAPA